MLVGKLPRFDVSDEQRVSDFGYAPDILLQPQLAGAGLSGREMSTVVRCLREVRYYVPEPKEIIHMTVGDIRTLTDPELVGFMQTSRSYPRFSGRVGPVTLGVVRALFNGGKEADFAE